MRSAAIELASSTLRRSGLSRLGRRSTSNRAGIVVYHDPDPETVGRHLDVLARYHAFVPLDAVVEALRSGRWNHIPPQSLAFSLDDGFRRNAELADAFAAYDAVPTIFVCSSIVGTDEPFWWTLPGIDAEALKNVPNAERIAAVSAARRRDGSPWALSREELVTLSRAWIVGAHTATHPILPQCNDQEAHHEIFGSKREVEALTGAACVHFAYPNGSYSDREVSLVRDAGFLSARTTEAGWIRDDTDPFRLPIVPMPDTASANRAIAQVTTVSIAPGFFRFGSGSTTPGAGAGKPRNRRR